MEDVSAARTGFWQGSGAATVAAAATFAFMLLAVVAAFVVRGRLAEPAPS